MKLRWKTYLLYASLVIIGGCFILLILETIRVKNTGFETKTLWDWMELLIIPLVLAIGAFFLQRSERAVEREIAKDRQQEEALQAYFDRMSDLLLKEELHDKRNTEVQDVARTWTLTVLRRVDANRKGQVIQFLYEALLIDNTTHIVYLGDANLVNANLKGADLRSASLRNANMKSVNLEDAHLEGANLEGAILDNAYLKGVHVTTEQLVAAKSLKGAIMPDGTIHE